jgi:hypothetical protein
LKRLGCVVHPATCVRVVFPNGEETHEVLKQNEEDAIGLLVHTPGGAAHSRWMSTAEPAATKMTKPAIASARTGLRPANMCRVCSPQANHASIGVYDEPVASQQGDFQVGAIAVQPLYRDTDDGRMGFYDGVPQGEKIDAIAHGFITPLYKIIH